MTRGSSPDAGEGQSYEAEKAYQARRAASIQLSRMPDSIIQRYAETKNWRLFAKECLFRQLNPVDGLRLLDFGCGEGEISVQLARLGARVVGVDISEELIEIARRRAVLDGVEGRVDFRAGDILDQDPTPEFDALICAAVLHHVDLHEVFPHLLGFTKPGGLVVIAEPIAFSDTLRAIRERVPIEANASPDERQLTSEDVDFLTARLDGVEKHHFRLASRLVRLLPAHWQDRRRRLVVYGLAAVDRALLSLLPPLRRLAGFLVISGRRPDGPGGGLASGTARHQRGSSFRSSRSSPAGQGRAK